MRCFSESPNGSQHARLARSDLHSYRCGAALRREKLPELARGLGQALGEFKKARDEFEREIRNATEVEVKTATDRQPSQPPPEASPGSVHTEAEASGSKGIEKPT